MAVSVRMTVVLRQLMAVIAGWIHQSHGDGRHAQGFPVARAGEDDVFHPCAAQTLGGLLTQDPANGVAQVRFSTAVGANDGCDAGTGKFHLGSIKERLEALDLNSLQFQQSTSSPSIMISRGDDLYTTRASWESKAG